MKDFFEKILNFIKNDTVQLVSTIVLVLCAAFLIVGGATEANIDNVVKLIVGVIDAISALIAGIKALLNKNEALKAKKLLMK